MRIRNVAALLLSILFVIALANAQTTISGAQLGNLGPGKYTVTGDITIASGKTLQIAPGTQFLHNQGVTWKISGLLLAKGSASDSIAFISQGSGRWGGIRFAAGAKDSSILDYCIVDNCASSSDGAGIHSEAFIILSHSRISNCEATGEAMGGGFHAIDKPAVIDNCLFFGNKAKAGGGINFASCPNIVIKNTIVRDNNAYFDGDS